MLENLRNGSIFFIVFFMIGMCSVVLAVKRTQRHSDILIITENEEFVVDDYNQDMNKECIYFTHEGHVKTICGNYEIIK